MPVEAVFLYGRASFLTSFYRMSPLLAKGRLARKGAGKGWRLEEEERRSQRRERLVLGKLVHTTTAELVEGMERLIGGGGFTWPGR